MHKRFFKTFIAALLLTSITANTVFADDVSDLNNEKDQAKQELDSLENDMAYLMTQLSDLEIKMADCYDNIEDVNKKLDEQLKIQESQYQDMKLRIKYMYEDQGTSITDIFLSAKDMGNLLNKAEYVQDVYTYDRNKLTEMANTANEIKQLKQELENEKNSLVAAQDELTEKQSLLYTTIDNQKGKIADLDEKIAEAARKAAEAAAAKEAAERAAEEARRAAELAAKKEQQNNNSNSDNTTTNRPSSGSAVADGVVSLAYSLLGVPYISGGSSPSGFDCSGFTSYLFRQYDIYVSRSSSAQLFGGVAVPSMDQALPGDVICYPGHVGLYVGDGVMIHANVPGGSVCLVGVYSIGMSVIGIRRYW